ncbi:MAG: hypothetical protein RR065_11955, partial [Clostridia bacterium]
MKLKVPKTERRRSNDSKARHIWRRVLLVLIVFVLLVLSGLHLLGLITGNKMLALPENAVATVLTPVQTGFSTVVDWVVEYFYKVKLRARIELEYNNLRQENEQLVYQAMLAEELQKKLTTPSGGTAGQSLVKTSSGYGWAAATVDESRLLASPNLLPA